MQVFKFGGTSVGSPENMRSVMNIIADGEPKIVVLSAMSGTTNTLVEISDYLHKKNRESASSVISKLESKYHKVVEELYEQQQSKESGLKVIEKCFDTIRVQLIGKFNAVKEQIILAQGELISTALVTFLLQENNHKAVLLPALDFMRIDEDKQADLSEISKLIKPILNDAGEQEIYITQGFICRNPEGEIDNLQRG